MDELIDKIEVLVRWPKRLTDEKNVVKWLYGKFKFKQKYPEKEVKQIIKKFHYFSYKPLLIKELICRKKWWFNLLKSKIEIYLYSPIVYS